MAVAHNGNLTNALALRRELEDNGSFFQTTMDSEVIVNLIARSKAANTEDRIIEAVRRIEGAFSLVISTNDKLIGVRDANGFRPLCLGKTEHGYVLSSETCALDAIKAEFIRHIEPGEMVIIDDNGVRSRLFVESGKKKLIKHFVCLNIFILLVPTVKLTARVCIRPALTWAVNLLVKPNMMRILSCPFRIPVRRPL